jgi:hypothetical protein
MYQLGRKSVLGWRAAAVAVACVVVAVAGIACSSRSSTGSAHLAASHSSGTPANDLLAAVSNSTSADTVHLKLVMSIDTATTGSQQVTGTGGVDFGKKAASIDMQVLGMDMQVVTADNTVYLHSAVLGNDWYSINAADSGMGGAGSLFANGFVDPSQQFALLKDAATDVTEIGTEQVNGESTTHYKATLDVAKAAAEEGANSSQIQQLEKAGISTLPVDVWVDGAGRVARLSLAYNGKTGGEGLLAGGKLSVTVDYTDYGKPVDVQIPPANQVKDLSESALGSMVRGGSAQ